MAPGLCELGSLIPSGRAQPAKHGDGGDAAFCERAGQSAAFVGRARVLQHLWTSGMDLNSALVYFTGRVPLWRSMRSASLPWCECGA